MQIVTNISDAPMEDYQDLVHKIHGMAASEGLYDDKNPSQKAKVLGAVLDILTAITNGIVLPEHHGDLPSVTPKPKTGHWIDDEFGSKCSCCDIYTHLDKFDRPMKFRHCSMCGAKMIEPQESEEP